MDPKKLIETIMRQKCRRPSFFPQMLSDWPMQIQIARAIVEIRNDVLEATAVSAVSEVCKSSAFRSRLINFQGCSFVPPEAVADIYYSATKRIAPKAQRVVASLPATLSGTVRDDDYLRAASPSEPICASEPHVYPLAQPKIIKEFPKTKKGVVDMVCVAVTSYRGHGIACFDGLNRDQRASVLEAGTELLRCGVLVYDDAPVAPNGRRVIMAVPLPPWHAQVLIHGLDRIEAAQAENMRLHTNLTNITKAIERLAMAWERTDTGSAEAS